MVVGLKIFHHLQGNVDDFEKLSRLENVIGQLQYRHSCNAPFLSGQNTEEGIRYFLELTLFSASLVRENNIYFSLEVWGELESQ